MVAETTGSLAALGAAKTNIHSREYRCLHMVAAHLHEQVSLPCNINLFSFYLCDPGNQRRGELTRNREMSLRNNIQSSYSIVYSARSPFHKLYVHKLCL